MCFILTVLGVVDLYHLLLQVGCYAVLELLDGIYSGGFQQLGELSAYALDAHEVGIEMLASQPREC